MMLLLTMLVISKLFVWT